MRSAVLLAGLAAGVAWNMAARAAEHMVVIDGVKFEPQMMIVQRGDTVVWTNKDPFPHTATAHGVFDSKEIGPGKSWKWTARKAGIYEYVCTLHPTMKGTISVK